MATRDGLVQIGQVQSVDYAAGTVRVLHPDAGINGSVSTDLPIIRPKRPEVGDSVICVYLSNGQAFGICLGAIYQRQTPPPESGQIIEAFALPGGASLRYDTANNRFILVAENVDVEATGTVNINGGTINLAGGGQAVARVGDTVQCGPYTGTITSGSSKVQSG